MTNEFQAVVPAPENPLEAQAPITIAEESGVPETNQIPVTNNNPAFPAVNGAPGEEVIATDINLQADKAAIIASGKFHLLAIYETEVKKLHVKIAELTAKYMLEAERATNWTHDEVRALWDKAADVITNSIGK